MGNIAKWAVELAEFQLDFHPRHAVKSQILADFIAKWTPSPSAHGGPDPDADPPRPEARTLVFTEPHWTLFFDGSICKKWAGAGVVLNDPSEVQVKYMVHLEFEATNNMAEYEALIFGLSATLSLGVRQLEGHFLFLDATYGLWLCAYWSRLFFRRTTYLKIGSCHRAYGRLILAKIWWYAGMSMERRWRQGW